MKSQKNNEFITQIFNTAIKKVKGMERLVLCLHEKKRKLEVEYYAAK